jgi:putative ABC transport system ATP-binding protein
VIPAASPDSGAAIPGVAVAEVVDVFKVYREGDTETVALRGASLSLRAGEFVTLLGPSGSGKSTLLSIMAGLTLPTAGRVMIGGRDLSRLNETERAAVRAEKIGLVFQRDNLISFLTTEENVELALRAPVGRRRSAGRARELLDALGLDSRRRHRPHQLSGGEAQRAGIAVALANEPDLILGDEITGELDSETSAQVMELLLRLRRENGLTLLVVTHNPVLAAGADRGVVISDGLIKSHEQARG